MFSVHTRQWMISDLGIVYEMKKRNALCGDPVCLSVVTRYRRVERWSEAQNCRANSCVVKFGSVTVIISLRSSVTFCTYFPYFLTYLGEIWCNVLVFR